VKFLGISSISPSGKPKRFYSRQIGDSKDGCQMDGPSKQLGSCRDNNNDTPTGGNDNAAGDKKCNELMTTSCMEEEY